MKLTDLFEAVIDGSAHALDVLGLQSGATLSDAKTAYRKLAQKLHPDKSDGDSEKMKLVNAAWDFLEKNGLDAKQVPEPAAPAHFNYSKENIKELEDKLEEILTRPSNSYTQRGRTYRKYESSVAFARERIELAKKFFDEILPAYEAIAKKMKDVWKDRFEKPEAFKAVAKEFNDFWYDYKPNDIQTLINRIAKKQASRHATYLKVEIPFQNAFNAQVERILTAREHIQQAMKDVERTPAERERAAKASARMKDRWAYG